MYFIIDGVKGRIKLQKVFLYYGVFGAFICAIAIAFTELLLDELKESGFIYDRFSAHFYCFILVDFYVLWLGITIWQCSKNVWSAAWTGAARVVGAIFVFNSLLDMISNLRILIFIPSLADLSLAFSKGLHG